MSASTRQPCRTISVIGLVRRLAQPASQTSSLRGRTLRSLRGRVARIAGARPDRHACDKPRKRISRARSLLVWTRSERVARTRLAIQTPPLRPLAGAGRTSRAAFASSSRAVVTTGLAAQRDVHEQALTMEGRGVVWRVGQPV